MTRQLDLVEFPEACTVGLVLSEQSKDISKTFIRKTFINTNVPIFRHRIAGRTEKKTLRNKQKLT